MAQMTYAYKVRDTDGKVVEGTLDARQPKPGSQSPAGDGLHADQHQGQDRPAACTRRSAYPGIGNRVPLKDIALFSRQFATLISSGLTLIRSLTILTDSNRKPSPGQDRHRRTGPSGKRRLAFSSPQQPSEGLQQAVCRRWSEPARPAVVWTNRLPPVEHVGKTSRPTRENQVGHGLPGDGPLPGLLDTDGDDPVRRPSVQEHLYEPRRQSALPYPNVDLRSPTSRSSSPSQSCPGCHRCHPACGGG